MEMNSTIPITRIDLKSFAISSDNKSPVIKISNVEEGLPTIKTSTTAFLAFMEYLFSLLKEPEVDLNIESMIYEESVADNPILYFNRNK